MLEFSFILHTPTFSFPPSPPPQVDRVVFCVFLNMDHEIYSKLMPKYFPKAAQSGELMCSEVLMRLILGVQLKRGLLSWLLHEQYRVLLYQLENGL